MGQLGLGGGRASEDPRGPLGGAPHPDAPTGLPPPLGGGLVAEGHARVPSAPNATEIVDILSHELRSPITTIHLGTKVLLGSGGDIPGAVRNEVVEAVEEEAERLYRLVENLQIGRAHV